MNFVIDMYKALTDFLRNPVVRVELYPADDVRDMEVSYTEAIDAVNEANSRIREIEYRYATEVTQNLYLQDLLTRNGIEWRKP